MMFLRALSGRKSVLALQLGALMIVSAVLHAAPPSTAETQAGWPELARGELEAAAAKARGALAANPSAPRAGYCLAKALGSLHRLGEAAALFERHERDHPDSGVGPLGRGIVSLIERDYPAAESLLALAAARFREAGDARGVMITLETLGSVLDRSARTQASIDTLTAAFDLATELAEPMALTYLRIQLGNMLAKAGRYAEAEEQLRLSSEESRAANLPVWEGHSENTLAGLTEARLDLDEALVHRRAALDAYERGGSLRGQVRALRNLGRVYTLRGELSRVAHMLHRARERAEELDDPGLVGGCLADLGALSYLLGDRERALQQTREGLAIAGNRMPAALRGNYRINLGIILTEEARYEEALAVLEEGFDAMRESPDPQLEAPLLVNMGHCLCRMGRHREGIARIERAIELTRGVGLAVDEAFALAALGWCESDRGNRGAADAVYRSADSLAEAGGYFEAQESVLQSRAELARDSGHPDEALAYLERLIEAAEGVRRRSAGATELQSMYFGARGRYYEEAIDLLYRLHEADPGAGHDAHAFELAQRGKARSFLDVLAEVNVDLRVRADPSYAGREKRILGRIAELLSREGSLAQADPHSTDDEIAGLQRELAVVENDIRQADTRYAELQYPRPATLDEIRRQLSGDGDLLLEYVLADSASYVWALTRRTFRFARLPGRAEIENRMRALLPLLNDYNLLGADASYFVSPARSVAAAVIDPLRSEIAQASNLIIAPHGILHYLPFEVLLTGEVPPTRDFSSLPYLINSADVTYVPSLSALRSFPPSDPPRAEPNGPQVLLVGNPVPPQPGDVDLFLRAAVGDAAPAAPAAAEELAELAAVFPGNVRVLSGADATVRQIQHSGDEGSVRLIHFATHGVYNERSPAFSGLLLSADPDTGDDGYLTVGEAFGLELDCDQIVLAACSSALGERVSGEGLVGLTRAFLYAGARSVVASLWSVSGEGTARLMRGFYERLRVSGFALRAHALAEAKREMIENPGGAGEPDHAHPYFWSAFVLVGDGYR